MARRRVSSWAAGALLAALLLISTAAAQQPQLQLDGSDDGEEALHPELGAPLTEQSSMAEIQAYPLVQLPGCSVATSPGSVELPTGLLDKCAVRLSLVPGEPQLFVFTIPDGAQMSVAISLHITGGAAGMSLWHPSTGADQPPSQIGSDLYASQAASQSWISVPPEVVASLPGQYILSVATLSGSPAATLRVDTPGPAVMLADADKRAMQAVAKACCAGGLGGANASDSAFCSVIAPKALFSPHSWANDLCHLAPSSCNARGQLTRLVLPLLGLACEAFPPQLGALPALRQLDLSGNSFAGVSASEVASALASSSHLEELALGNTGLTGSLPCDLALPRLRVLDLSYNYLEGSLPGCLLDRLTELYVPGNSLTGGLGGWGAGSSLVTLYANQQRPPGLTGSLPAVLPTLTKLRHLNLGGNALSGALPTLPAGIRLFNVTSNNLSGRLGSLPGSIWIYDASSNALSGRLPPLSVYKRLEAFLASGNTLQGGVPDLPPGLRQLELAGCGLTGPLPSSLPSSLRRLDLSDNGLSGSAEGIDTSRMEVLRLANNGLTGGLPPGASVSPRLMLLDLSGNRLGGSLPPTWAAPRLQMLLLDNNTLSGTIPAGLAGLRKLGVLRLGANRLSGSLEAFAGGLRDPAEAAAQAAAAGRNGSSGGVSSLFDVNLADNQLTGPVPDQLAWLGVFNPGLNIVVPGPRGGPASAPRGLHLDGNRLAGTWPGWLLGAVPASVAVCGCAMSVTLDGADMRLSCPPGEVNITDYMWQVAAGMRYSCWDGAESRQAQLLDFLVSPANSDDTTANHDPARTARGDSGGAAPQQAAGPSGSGGGRPSPAAVAGGVVAGLLGAALVGVGAFFAARAVAARRARAFTPFKDAPGTAAAAAAGGGSVAAADVVAAPGGGGSGASRSAVL